MEITLEEIGKRLKEVRKYYNFKQKDIAEKVGVAQNMVSRLEAGRTIGTDKLILFLSFYSQYINLDMLFDKHFDLITSEKIFTKDIHLNSIFFEKLKQLENKIKENNQIINKDINDLLKFGEQNRKEEKI